MEVSVVILTKNEDQNIERCLESLYFCHEIIIIDDNSEDKTLEIARRYRTKIFKRSLNNDFSSQRNFGMNLAKGEWILFLDADEELSESLQREFIAKIESSEISAFYIKRRDYFWGREMKFGELLKMRNIGIVRLFKKDSGKWEGLVHEEFRTSKAIGILNGFINHYPHNTIKEFIQSVNYYSKIRAKELYKQSKKTNILEIIFYPLGKFILTYIIYLGFLDGAEGFIYAFFMSFHSFLVRAKLYQYWNIDDTRK